MSCSALFDTYLISVCPEDTAINQMMKDSEFGFCLILQEMSISETNGGTIVSRDPLKEDPN